MNRLFLGLVCLMAVMLNVGCDIKSPDVDKLTKEVASVQKDVTDLRTTVQKDLKTMNKRYGKVIGENGDTVVLPTKTTWKDKTGKDYPAHLAFVPMAGSRTDSAEGSVNIRDLAQGVRQARNEWNDLREAAHELDESPRPRRPEPKERSEPPPKTSPRRDDRVTPATSSSSVSGTPDAKSLEEQITATTQRQQDVVQSLRQAKKSLKGWDPLHAENSAGHLEKAQLKLDLQCRYWRNEPTTSNRKAVELDLIEMQYLLQRAEAMLAKLAPPPAYVPADLLALENAAKAKTRAAQASVRRR